MYSVKNDRYTSEDILLKCRKEWERRGPENFYQAVCINYEGMTQKDDPRFAATPYTEIIADFVLGHMPDYQAVQPVRRTKSYCIPDHELRAEERHCILQENPHPKREEEYRAIDLFWESIHGKAYEGFGRIIDYQVPLKNKKSDSLGKIDLLSVNQDKLFILELKRPDSRESFLRCILEGFSYTKTVDCRKLKEDFSEKISECTSIPLEQMQIRFAPLIYAGSRPAQEWECCASKFPYLAKLIEMTQAEVFVLQDISS